MLHEHTVRLENSPCRTVMLHLEHLDRQCRRDSHDFVEGLAYESHVSLVVVRPVEVVQAVMLSVPALVLMLAVSKASSAHMVSHVDGKDQPKSCPCG